MNWSLIVVYQIKWSSFIFMKLAQIWATKYKDTKLIEIIPRNLKFIDSDHNTYMG